MSVPVRIVVFVLVLVASLGAGYGIGAAVSPVEAGSKHSLVGTDHQTP